MRACDYGVCTNIAKTIGTYVDNTRTSCTKAACSQAHQTALTEELASRQHDVTWKPAPYAPVEIQ